MLQNGQKKQDKHIHNPKNTSKYLTCTNDIRISWWIIEYNFTSFHNCLKMIKYYVNASEIAETSKKIHKQYKNA